MNYWQRLQQAERDLSGGRLRAAEAGFLAACAEREQDQRRVVLTERIPDGLHRAWQRLRGEVTARPGGRWDARRQAFAQRFEVAARELAFRARARLDLGAGDDPDGAARDLEEALFLAVDSTLATCPLAVSDLLPALLSLAPHTGHLPDLALVPGPAQLPVALRLQLAELAVANLADLPAAVRKAWTDHLLMVLDAEAADADPTLEPRRCWLAARLADRDLEDAALVLERWEACDQPDLPGGRRHWARLRRLELLAGCDRRRFDVPAAQAARLLAVGLPRDGGGELATRLAAALAVLDYRAPVADPDLTWYSGDVDPAGVVRLVAWWGDCPRDVLCWRPGTPVAALAGRIAAARGRVVWAGDQVPGHLVDALAACGDAGSPSYGRALRPFTMALLAPVQPAGAWTDEVARGLALARSGPWRQDWRPDLGLADLTPPGLDGHLQPDQQPVRGALDAGLGWLAVLHRIDDADPALRAGLGELGRRGQAAAAFLHDLAVLGAPDKVSVDAGFTPWTLPLLWTRPDPLGRAADALEAPLTRPDLGGQNVAVVAGGDPAAVMRAWSEGDRRWRVVLDRMQRLDDLAGLARESFGPVTLVPRGGRVHCLAPALRRLDDLVAADAEADDLLAICHWINLVETHNGNLLDDRAVRGDGPLSAAYAAAIVDLPTEEPGVEGDGWGAQYAQRARRSGLVAGLADDLPTDPARLDADWGVYDGSEASWVFLDGAAVHWRFAHGEADQTLERHRLLASRGRRHLSLLAGRGVFPGELAGWFEAALAPYGRPYHADLAGPRAGRLRLAGRAPLPGSYLSPGAHLAWSLARLADADAQTCVCLPGGGPEAAAWSAAAAGRLGPITWRPVGSYAEARGRQLVVPALVALADHHPGAAPADDPAAWSRADAERQAWLATARREAALETAVLQAMDVASVEVLDPRWWRWLAPGADGPEAALAAEDGSGLSVLTPADPPSGALADAAARWFIDAGRVAGLVHGSTLPPLVAAEAVVLDGRHLHPGGAAQLWPRLASAWCRAWEQGEPALRLLVVGEAPPPGMASLVQAMGLPGRSLIDAAVAEPAGPLVWARPATLIAALQRQHDPGDLDAVLILELDGLLPAEGEGNDVGAGILGWLGTRKIGRVDLVGGPLSPAWREFLGRHLGGVVHADAAGPGGWAGLRRAVAPRTARCCPQCGHRGPGEVQGLVCAACGQDLGHPSLADDLVARAEACGRSLLGQVDLGRDRPLELWGSAEELAAVRRESLAAGGRAVADDPLAVALADGRRWRLCPLQAGATAADDRAVLLSLPAAPDRLRPRAAVQGMGELSMMYDLADLRRVTLGAPDVAVARLLAVLEDAEALAAVAPDAGGAAPSSVTTWSLAWLSGLPEQMVRRQLGDLRWAARLGEAPTVRPPVAPREVRVRMHTSVRDLELQLGGLASHLQAVVSTLHGGAAAGTRALVSWPQSEGPGHALPRQLDRLLTLAATPRWRQAVRSAPAIIHDLPDGAWFSARRLVGRLGPTADLTGGLAEVLDEFSRWCDRQLREASRVDTGYLIEVEVDRTTWPWLILGQELGFWAVSPGLGGAVVGLGEVRDRLQPAIAAADAPCRMLLMAQAAALADWRRQLAATPAGGALASLPAPAVATTGRRWWQRGGSDPLQAVRRDVAELVGAPRQRTLVLSGAPGTGRLQGLLSGLQEGGPAQAAEWWCPDLETAMRVQLAARACDPGWNCDLHVLDDPTEAAVAPRAARERRPVVLIEAQRFPREARYKLQDAGREPGLLVTVDADQAASGEAWEDLFVATPREADVRRLRTPILPARLPAEVLRQVDPAAVAEARPHRRDRGQISVKRSGTIDECAAAVSAARAAGQLGDDLLVLAPHAEDVDLLCRALTDRGWAAARRRDVAALMLPGVLHAVAVLADAHRQRTGHWPGGAGLAPAGPPLLPLLGGDALPAGWNDWLRAGGSRLEEARVLLDHWRRSPWGQAAGSSATARQRIAAWCEGQPTDPQGVLTPALWAHWRRALGRGVGRDDLLPDLPTASLATADAPAGAPSESLAYVCFGSEPAQVHRRCLAQATDRILVLYQERSPVPGEDTD